MGANPMLLGIGPLAGDVLVSLMLPAPTAQTASVVYDNYDVNLGDVGCGLISHWSAEGDTTDSADGNDGFLEGGAAFAAGYVGQAFSFNGSTGSVRVPDAANLDIADEFTLEAWINLSS